MLNMDMMGRLRQPHSVSGTGTATEFDEMLPRVVSSHRPDHQRRTPEWDGPLRSATSTVGTSRSCSSSAANTMTTTPPAITRGRSTPKARLESIALAGDLADEMLTRDEMLTFQQSNSPEPGSSKRSQVRLGIMPSYTSDLETGVLVDGVSEGTSAASAGVTEGDVLLKWNDVDLEDGSVLMQQLMKHKPGDVIQLKVRRNGELIDLPVTEVARRDKRATTSDDPKGRPAESPPPGRSMIVSERSQNSSPANRAATIHLGPPLPAASR